MSQAGLDVNRADVVVLEYSGEDLVFSKSF